VGFCGEVFVEGVGEDADHKGVEDEGEETSEKAKEADGFLVFSIFLLQVWK